MAGVSMGCLPLHQSELFLNASTTLQRTVCKWKSFEQASCDFFDGLLVYVVVLMK